MQRKYLEFLVTLCFFAAPPFLNAAPGQARTDDLRSHFESGKEALASGNLTKAVEEFQKVVRIDPSLYQARVNLGLAYHAMGDLPRAADALAAARNASTKIGGANFILGSDYIALGKPALAIAPLEDAVRDGVAAPGLQATLCSAYVKAGRFSEVSSCVASVYGSPPEKAEDWYQLGRQYLQAARTLTSSLRQRFPNDGWTKRLNGDVAAENSNWKLAARFYSEALASGTGSGFHSSYGYALLHLDQVSEAEQQFKRELAISKDSEAAQTGLAVIALMSGNIQLARSEFDAVAKRNPWYLANKSKELSALLPEQVAATILSEAGSHSASTGFLTALALRKAGKTEEAERTVESMRRDKQADPKVSEPVNKGMEFVETGQFDRAARTLEPMQRSGTRYAEWGYWLTQAYLGISNECFHELLEKYPSSALAYRLQAEYAEIGDNLQSAIENYRRAVALAPQDATLHAALANVLFQQGNIREAAEHAEAALKLQPESPELLVLAGKVDLAGGSSAQAESRARKALSLEPALLSAHELLGRILWKQGDAKQAAVELRQAVSLDEYGDIHYLLYRAYQKLGNTASAAQALAESKRLRQATLADAQQRVSQGAPAARNAN